MNELTVLGRMMRPKSAARALPARMVYALQRLHAREAAGRPSVYDCPSCRSRLSLRKAEVDDIFVVLRCSECGQPVLELEGNR